MRDEVGHFRGCVVLVPVMGRAAIYIPAPLRKQNKPHRLVVRESEDR